MGCLESEWPVARSWFKTPFCPAPAATAPSAMMLRSWLARPTLCRRRGPRASARPRSPDLEDVYGADWTDPARPDLRFNDLNLGFYDSGAAGLRLEDAPLRLSDLSNADEKELSGLEDAPPRPGDHLAGLHAEAHGDKDGAPTAPGSLSTGPQPTGLTETAAPSTKRRRRRRRRHGPDQPRRSRSRGLPPESPASSVPSGLTEAAPVAPTMDGAASSAPKMRRRRHRRHRCHRCRPPDLSRGVHHRSPASWIPSALAVSSDPVIFPRFFRALPNACRS